jgi:hypothetical protein
VVVLAARGYGNERVERIEFYREHRCKKGRSIVWCDLEHLNSKGNSQ